MEDRQSGIVKFESNLEHFGITLTTIQMQQFIDYYELLVEWNERMNLTAITEFKEVIIKHFVDSLSIVNMIRPKNEKIIDLGTGAGFPGIPLKIAFPETNIILLDSLNKRIQFLDAVIEKLQLSKVKAIHGRAEDYGRDAAYRAQFDLSVSRAVAKLPILCEYCLPFVRKGGYFISYKSALIEEELSMSENAMKQLGGKSATISSFKLPGTDIERTLIAIQKIGNTPAKYPRASGKPSKEPL